MKIRRVLLAVTVLIAMSGTLSADQLIPLADGNRWEYTVSASDVISFGEGDSARSVSGQKTGRHTEEITLVKGGGPEGQDVYKSTATTQTDGEKPGEAKIELLFLLSSKGLEITATRMSGLGEALSGEWEKYDQPLLLIKADAKPGDTWKVGTVREGGLRVPQVAKVMGYETVKVPAGEFKDCLKVCLSTDRVLGSMDFGDVQLKAKTGKSVDTYWIAKGVGIVKQQTLLQISVDVPDASGEVVVPVTTTSMTSRELEPGYKVD